MASLHKAAAPQLGRNTIAGFRHRLETRSTARFPNIDDSIALRMGVDNRDKANSLFNITSIAVDLEEIFNNNKSSKSSD